MSTVLLILLLAAVWAWVLWPWFAESVRFWRNQRRARAAVAPPRHRNVVVYEHHRRPAPIDVEAEGWLDWR